MRTFVSHKAAKGIVFFVLLVSLLAMAAVPGAPATAKAPYNGGKVIFFVSDGMRQDLAKTFADQGSMPTVKKLFDRGVFAADNGLLTQAPVNTGAGWHSLASGAWSAVTGSTNNTFHVSGQPFANRTGSFDTGALKVETLAQSTERGGKKVAQIEWAGGRNALINGPTVDYRSFFGPRCDHQLCCLIRSGELRSRVWPPVRSPGRLRRAAALPWCAAG